MIFNTKLNKAFIKSTVYNELLMCNSTCSVVHGTVFKISSPPAFHLLVEYRDFYILPVLLSLRKQ